MSKKDRQKKAFFKKIKEPIWVSAVKYLMTALFAYGIVFWSGVTFLSLFSGSFGDFDQPLWVGISMAAGLLLIIVCVVFAIVRKYIAAFLFGALGSAALLTAAGWFVKTARQELENRAVPNDLLDLDKRYMYRALPVLAGAILALVLAIIRAAGILRARRKKRREEESSPVKSIVD